MSINNIKLNQYINVLAMYLVSGTYLFFMEHAGISVISYFLLVFFYLIKGYLKFRVISGFYYLLYFLSFSSVNYLIINPNHLSNGEETIFICYILFAITTYIIISNYNFHDFKKILLNISSFFATIGLIAYLAVVSGMMEYTILYNRKLCLMQNLSWTGEDARLAGIFWEPGAFQIVLILCLILYWDDLRNRKCSKGEFRKLLILSIAMLATQSSWGYVCFAYYIFTVALGWNMAKKSLWKYIVIIPMILIGIYFLLTSPVISNKLAQAENTRVQTSYSIRLNDNMALLKMIEEKPLFGYGIATVEFRDRSNLLDNNTSSNGILQMGATLGLIMLFIYLFYTYKSAKKMFSDKVWLLFPLFLLIQMAEVFYYFPLSYILLFPFKSYTRNLTNE